MWVRSAVKEDWLSLQPRVRECRVELCREAVQLTQVQLIRERCTSESNHRPRVNILQHKFGKSGRKRPSKAAKLWPSAHRPKVQKEIPVNEFNVDTEEIGGRSHVSRGRSWQGDVLDAPVVPAECLKPYFVWGERGSIAVRAKHKHRDTQNNKAI